MKLLYSIPCNIPKHYTYSSIGIESVSYTHLRAHET